MAFGQIEQNEDAVDDMTPKADSLKVLRKNIPNLTVIDTNQVDSTSITKEYLDDNIIHKSKDYMSNDFINQKATLYDEAELFYHLYLQLSSHLHEARRRYVFSGRP